MSLTATPADVLAGAARWCVVEGDSAEVLRGLPYACVDAVVTDPPAGINFMSLEFDRDRGGRAQWVAWLAEVLGYARAATRDGGRALVWSLPRTSHWTGCAVEDAGWAIENTVTHLFGTGWPKGKSQLKPLAETWWLARTGRSAALNIEGCRVKSGASPSIERRETAARTGNTPAGKTSAGGWERRNTAEHYTAEREGERAGRYPPNVVFSHAPGCRCVGEKRVLPNGQRRFCTEFAHDASAQGYGGGRVDEFITTTNPGIGDDGTELVEAWECVEGCPVRELDSQSGELSARGNVSAGVAKPRGWSPTGYGAGIVRDNAPHQTYDAGGGASRFFPCFPADEGALFGYHAKPSRAERDAGVSLDAERHVVATGRMLNPVCLRTGTRAQHCKCGACAFDGDADPKTGNNHPTVKSVSLMRWLVRLVSRPGDVVLDPFGGSGTTGAAALAEGRRVILVERDPRFAEIARQRCAHATPDLGAPIRVPARAVAAPAGDARQLGLFDAGGAR